MIKLFLDFNEGAIIREITLGAKPTIHGFIVDAAENMRRLMKLPKRGILYSTHRASAPGEAPAILSGKLMGSIHESFPSDLSGELRVGAEYARYLDPQEGDPANIRVLPRPFVEPSINGAIRKANQGGILSNLL